MQNKTILVNYSILQTRQPHQRHKQTTHTQWCWTPYWLVQAEHHKVCVKFNNYQLAFPGWQKKIQILQKKACFLFFFFLRLPISICYTRAALQCKHQSGSETRPWLKISWPDGFQTLFIRMEKIRDWCFRFTYLL